MDLRRCTWALLAATIAAPACASDVRIDDGDDVPRGAGGAAADEPPPTACGGALTSRPRTIARDVGTGTLHVAAGGLVLVDVDGGRVAAVDPCSGAVTELADLPGALTSAAVVGDDVLLAVDAPPRLLRVPVAGGEIVAMGELAARTELVAHGDRLFARQDLPLDATDADDGQPDSAFFALDATSGAATLLHRQRVWAPGTRTRVVGASDAGVYFSQFFDCGCNPGLVLVPAGGGSAAAVTDSAGARDLATVGDALFLAVDLESLGFGELFLDVVRMPLAGGDPEVLLERSEEHATDVRGIAADERAVCWAPWGRAVRCMAAEPGAAVRVVGDDEDERAGGEDLAMHGGAVHWLSERHDGRVELRAAVP